MANPNDPYVSALRDYDQATAHANLASPSETTKTHLQRTLEASLNEDSRPTSRSDSPPWLDSKSNKADAGSPPQSGTPSRHDSDGKSSPRPKRSLESSQQYNKKGAHARTKHGPSRSNVLSGAHPAQRGLRPEDVDPNFRRKQDQPPSPPAARAESGGETPTSSVLLSQTHASSKTARSGQRSSNHSKRDAVAPTPPSEQSQQQAPATTRHFALSKVKYNPQWPGLLLQPESREISQEQLAAEVKSIYTGLTMVETKCIHIDKAQAATPKSESKITDEHWQAMIALHRTLLHEHHDFFLASQHPSASPALKRLALKYSMPARMWKHGIHSFLELLRHRLPESLEYMLAFIYLAYQMMALLYETVDSFRTTWVECLGDLGRYRMAVEDEDIRDREIWAGVARSWYNKAADTNPAIGRLWHHLAILARPNMVQQLYLYNRSLTSIVPFLNARESIVTIFDPVLVEHPKVQLSTIDLDFLKINALLFRQTRLETVSGLTSSYTQQLDSTIARLGDQWREIGAFSVIAMVGTLYQFGNQDNDLRFMSDQHRKRLQLKDPSCLIQGLPDDQAVSDLRLVPQMDGSNAVVASLAVELFVSSIGTILLRRGDKNVLSAVHISLVLLLHLYDLLEAHGDNKTLNALLNTFHWHSLCLYLNTLILSEENIDLLFVDRILFEEDGRPLPEDWMLRGAACAFEYTPRDWFESANDMEEEERYMQLTSTMKARVDRVLSIAARFAAIGTHMSFDREATRFFVPGTDDLDADIDMDEGYYSLSGGDSVEMLQAIKDPQEVSTAHMADQLGRKYSSIIANVDVLINPSLFRLLLKTPLPVIIPEQAILELLRVGTEYTTESGEAALALSEVRSALHDHHNQISIKTKIGEDVTTAYIESPQAFMLDKSSKMPPKTVERMNEAIAGIARRETESTIQSRRTNTGFSSIASRATFDTNITAMEEDDVKPPVQSHAVDHPKPLVITDDRNLRANAKDFGAAAIAGWMVKKWLVQTRKNSTGSSEGTVVGTAMEVDQPVRMVQ